MTAAETKKGIAGAEKLKRSPWRRRTSSWRKHEEDLNSAESTNAKRDAGIRTNASSRSCSGSSVAEGDNDEKNADWRLQQSSLLLSPFTQIKVIQMMVRFARAPGGWFWEPPKLQVLDRTNRDPVRVPVQFNA
ncbi:unnamed protein product [Linum tenue]|uniref:Uncharacterized protein n=1 Tax=Linum tenue TaxID=586396 RepID=A0AAV0JGC4_9ROSI|nr:unnamed protein product [Linum tenue]